MERTSATLTNRSGSGSGSCFFSSVTFRMPPKNIFCLHFFPLVPVPVKAHLHHYSKIKKVIKKSQNSRNEGFSSCFCLMMEGSRSGSVPLTNGSGSRRPENLQIRIRNTGFGTASGILLTIAEIFFFCRARGGIF